MIVHTAKSSISRLFSVSIVLPVRCVSATSSVYIRLINKYWSKLRSDIMLCVRALWVIFFLFFSSIFIFQSSCLAYARTKPITFTIYVSNNSHTATGSRKCSTKKYSQNHNNKSMWCSTNILNIHLYLRIQLYLRHSTTAHIHTHTHAKPPNVNIYQSTKLKFKLFDCFKI